MKPPRTTAIGLLYSSKQCVVDEFAGEVTQVIARRLCRYNCQLTGVPIDTDVPWQDFLVHGRISACIAFQQLPGEVRRWLRANDQLCLMLNPNADATSPQLAYDHRGAALVAAEHLLSLGHRRIAYFVHESITLSHKANERRLGFEVAMRAVGALPMLWRINGMQATEFLVRGRSRPTAIIVDSILEANVISHAMEKHGLAVPNDVSIVILQHDSITSCAAQQLTSVEFSAVQVGGHSAKILGEMLSGRSREGRRANFTRMIKPELVIRTSTLDANVSCKRSHGEAKASHKKAV